MDFISFNKKKPIELRLQFYNEQPSSKVPLETVEELAIERLKVLRCIEAVGQDYVKGSKVYYEKLEAQLCKCSQLGKSFTYNSEMDLTKSIKDDIKNDVLSHFILALAYCRTEDLTRWFLTQEMNLFQYRLMIETNHDPKTIDRFTKANNIKLVSASTEETEKLQLDYPHEINNVFKVRFEEVIDLVKQRRCRILRGFVYLVTMTDISSVLLSRLRVHLSHTLAVMRANVTIIDQDCRLRPLLATLNKRYIGKSYCGGEKDDEKIVATQIPQLARESFPPCMEQVHRSLIQERHLKHAGRMQYGLFLKGIGLPLEESLRFFADSFQPKTDSDGFQKRYAYNIRHNYGQEGKKANYSPHSCVKIITTVSNGDCCGCPFKTTDPELMAQRLRNSTKATPEQIENIVTKSRNNQYQISCRDYFKVVHDLPNDYPVAINHPNQYFEESRKVFKDRSMSGVTN